MSLVLTIQNPKLNPFWEKSNMGRERGENKTAFNSGHVTSAQRRSDQYSADPVGSQKAQIKFHPGQLHFLVYITIVAVNILRER